MVRTLVTIEHNWRRHSCSQRIFHFKPSNYFNNSYWLSIRCLCVLKDEQSEANLKRFDIWSGINTTYVHYEKKWLEKTFRVRKQQVSRFSQLKYLVRLFKWKRLGSWIKSKWMEYWFKLARRFIRFETLDDNKISIFFFRNVPLRYWSCVGRSVKL